MSESSVDLEKLFQKIARGSQSQEVMGNLKGIGVIVSVKGKDTYVNTYAVLVEKDPSSSDFPNIGKLLDMKHSIQKDEKLRDFLRRHSFAILEFGRRGKKEYFMQCLIAGPRYYCVRFTNVEKSPSPKDSEFQCSEKSTSELSAPARESSVKSELHIHKYEAMCLALLNMMIQHISRG